MSDKRQGTFFWPILLIAIGLLWLLGNIGVIGRVNFLALLRLWPLILIVIGLNLIVGRRSPLLSALIAVGAVIFIVAFLAAAPSLNLGGDVEIKEAHFSEQIGDATAARIDLELSVGETTIEDLADSPALIEADLKYIGEVDFDVSGGASKNVRLTVREDDLDRGFFDFLGGLDLLDGDELVWEIGLSPRLPIDLDVSSGVGVARLDLTDLLLTGLRVDGGVGEMDIALPATEDSYAVRINGGVGSFEVTIPEGAAVSLNIDSGVGEFVIDVPRDAAVRIEADTGIGGIDVPSYFEVVRRDDRTVGDSGVWETPGFSSASRQIFVEFDGGVGGLKVR